MSAGKATTRWRDEPVKPTSYEEVAELVALARKVRGRIVEFDWPLAEDELRRLRKAAYAWGSEISGRYRAFDARVLSAINEALGERHTSYVLSVPKNAAGTDCTATCARDGAGFRLQGHAPFDVLLGYGMMAVEDDPDEHEERGDSVWKTLESAIDMLDWDLRQFVRPELRAVQNALYGLPLDYGIDKPTAPSDTPAKEVSVQFKGPYAATDDGPHPCLFTADAAEACGVYIWTIEVSGEHRPWYVGQTQRGFALRTGEHLRSYFCGEYNVYDPEALARGENRVLWHPSTERATWPATLPAFIQHASSLTPKVLDLCRLVRFHVASLDGDKRLFERVEGAIGRHFKKLRDEFFDAGIRLPAQIPYEPAMRLKIASEVPIVGLPADLDA